MGQIKTWGRTVLLTTKAIRRDEENVDGESCSLMLSFQRQNELLLSVQHRTGL